MKDVWLANQRPWTAGAQELSNNAYHTRDTTTTHGRLPDLPRSLGTRRPSPASYELPSPTMTFRDPLRPTLRPTPNRGSCAPSLILHFVRRTDRHSEARSPAGMETAAGERPEVAASTGALV